MLTVLWDSPLVQHLPTSWQPAWQPAWQPSSSLPPTTEQALFVIKYFEAEITKCKNWKASDECYALKYHYVIGGISVDGPLCILNTLKVKILVVTVITARKRSLGQGNVFTPVCLSVHRGFGFPACSGKGGGLASRQALGKGGWIPSMHWNWERWAFLLSFKIKVIQNT